VVGDDRAAREVERDDVFGFLVVCRFANRGQ
jgi:hypothetical protein